jgi:GTP-binding protein
LWIIGVEGFEIGDTIADFENPEGLKTIDMMSLQ